MTTKFRFPAAALYILTWCQYVCRPGGVDPRARSYQIPDSPEPQSSHGSSVPKLKGNSWFSCLIPGWRGSGPGTRWGRDPPPAAGSAPCHRRTSPQSRSVLCPMTSQREVNRLHLAASFAPGQTQPLQFPVGRIIKQGKVPYIHVPYRRGSGISATQLGTLEALCCRMHSSNEKDQHSVMASWQQTYMSR